MPGLPAGHMGFPSWSSHSFVSEMGTHGDTHKTVRLESSVLSGHVDRAKVGFF